MEVSTLFKMMNESDRLKRVLDDATLKDIDISVIKKMCDPKFRMAFFQLIYDGKYEIFPPTIAEIPKDEPGKFREVYINTPLDRILLALINDCLLELFKDMIHPTCVSYQKGIGTQYVVKKVSKVKSKIGKVKNHVGIKVDFSKYFDNVSIDIIDEMFDIAERKLKFQKNTEPIINLLRKYYHQDLYFDKQDNLCSRYQGLKQGCAVASWLANVCLYELDEYMSQRYQCYYRYSDDVIVIDKHTHKALDEINSIIKKYGVALNPKKVEELYNDQWFKFLGFELYKDMIGLSKSRIHKFKEEIDKRTILKENTTIEKAKRDVVKYLYFGNYSWASSCLKTLNVEHQIKELNKYVMDSIRAVETGYRDIGGLGVSKCHKHKLVWRTRGSSVTGNRHEIPTIDGYHTMMCMKNNMMYSKPVFDALVRDMLK